MSLTTTTSTTTTSKVPEVNTIQLQALAEVCSTVTGAEPLVTVPNIVMNSLVSPTKVVTDDTLTNPIVSSSISLPAFPVPITSLGIPLMTMRSDDNDAGGDVGKKSPGLGERIDIEEDKLSDAKKDELMPIEELDDDAVVQMAAQIEENIAEIDEDVDDRASAALKVNAETSPPSDGETKQLVNGTEPEEGMAVVETNFPLNNSNNSNNINNNTTEPMECAPPATNPMASPKHINVVNDVNMLESVSVCILFVLGCFT